MQHRLAAVFAALSALLASTGAAAQPVKFLGLEFGVPQKALPRCTTADITNHPNKRLCWLGRPIADKDGSLSGSAVIPGSALPSWAVHGIYSLTVSKTNAIQWISMKPPGPCSWEDADKIVNSVSLRFGASRDLRNPAGYILHWRNKDGVASFWWSDSSCSLSFGTVEFDAAKAKEFAERKRAEAVRPVMP